MHNVSFTDCTVECTALVQFNDDRFGFTAINCISGAKGGKKQMCVSGWGNIQSDKLCCVKMQFSSLFSLHNRLSDESWWV